MYACAFFFFAFFFFFFKNINLLILQLWFPFKIKKKSLTVTNAGLSCKACLDLSQIAAEVGSQLGNADCRKYLLLLGPQVFGAFIYVKYCSPSYAHTAQKKLVFSLNTVSQLQNENDDYRK